MSRRHLRGLASAASALVLLTALGACGSSEEESGSSGSGGSSSSEPSGEASGGGTEPTVDLADPGDDLLDGATRGVVLQGTSARLTWRFPESYEPQNAQQASASGDGGEKFDLSIGYKAGTTAAADGEAMKAQAEPGQEVTVDEVEIGDKKIVRTATESDSGTLRTFLWTPDGADGTYAVLFLSYGAGLDDTPAERLDEVYQTVGSLALDGGSS